MKPNDDRRVHEADEALVEGKRRGAGERDREPARPDPGGERHDQRIEAEASDDQPVQAIDRQAGQDAGAERKRRRHAALQRERGDDGAERDDAARRDVDRARHDAEHRADRHDRQRGVLLDQGDDVRERREARIDDGEDDGEEKRRHDDGVAAERGAEAAGRVDESLADRLAAFAAALDQPAGHHGGEQEEAGRGGLPGAGHAADGHVVEDHHQDQRADDRLPDADAPGGKAAGAERHDGDREELQADADRRADDAGARRGQHAADAGERAAADIGESAEPQHRHAAEPRRLRVVADRIEPPPEQRAAERRSRAAG